MTVFEVPPELGQTSASVRRLGLAVTSGCDRVRVLTQQGVDTAKVASRLFGLPVEGVSAAALTTGNQQEASLLRAGAAPLLDLLVDGGRLAPGERGFVDIRSLPAARQPTETLRLVAGHLSGDHHGVHLVAQPTFEVRLWGRALRFRADFAVLPGSSDASLGEKKSFHDFEGDTDQAAMRGLLDQGGGYYAFADLALRQAGLAAQAERLRPTLDAVLRGPRIYPIGVAEERDRMLGFLSDATAADLDDIAADAARAAGTTVVTPDLVEALDTNRGRHCTSCPLRNQCRDRAWSAGDLSVLSTPTRTAATAAGSAARAAEVAAGTVVAAPHEQRLAASAAAVRDELTTAGWSPRRFSA